jgi:hypothetical protein
LRPTWIRKAGSMAGFFSGCKNRVRPGAAIFCEWKTVRTDR